MEEFSDILGPYYQWLEKENLEDTEGNYQKYVMEVYAG
mgnify:CR=1 FL=1